MRPLTKEVEYWVELVPGWHDSQYKPWLTSEPEQTKYEGNRRIKVIVQLPCFGGSAEVDATVEANTIETTIEKVDA